MQLIHTLSSLALVASVLPAQNGRQLFETYGAGFSRNGGYATSIAVIGDINGDTFDDIAVGDPTLQLGPSPSGTVEFLSGVDGSVIRSSGTTSESSLGELVAATGDVNGDGVPDVLASSTASVLLFSGADGSLLRTVAVFRTAAIAGPGDWNSDQTPDLAWVDAGVVQIVSGLDGSSIASLGSGVTSLATVAGAAGQRGVAVRASTGVALYTTAGAPAWSVAGYSSVHDAGDLNGDQLGDVLAVSTSASAVLSGADGSVLLSLPGGDNGAGGVDIDVDGTPDIAVGTPSAASSQGSTSVFSGATGALLFARTGRESGDSFGWDVAMHPGAGSATRSAVLVGSRGKFNGSVDAGAVEAIALAAPGEVDGSWRQFGQGCNFTSTRLRPGGSKPTVGQTYGFRFDSNSQTTNFQYLLIGESNTTFNGAPLPTRLPGVRSCDLLVSIDIVQTANFGSPFQSIAIPLNPIFVGYVVHVQGISIFGFPVLETSDAATLTIGN